MTEIVPCGRLVMKVSARNGAGCPNLQRIFSCLNALTEPKATLNAEDK